MRWEAFRQTRAYDFLVGLPLMAWFAYAAIGLRPRLVSDIGAALAGTAGLLTWLRIYALLASMAFNLMLVYLLTIRTPPVRRSKGVLPRLCGFTGTFLGVGIIYLPVASLSLPWQGLADLLIFCGGTGSTVVLAKLGRAFAIMPEARVLVTSGVYARVRHPLYTAEIVTVAGTAMQFAQPWAALLAVGAVLLLGARSVFEERVLAEAYPEYAAYRARTWRFIPGVI